MKPKPKQAQPSISDTGNHEDKPAGPRAIHFHGPGYATSPSFAGTATFAAKTFLGVAPYLNT